jgi:glycosyltransferase involved in cell wall biosynthesis
MADLRVFIFSDLLSEELACVESCLQEMKLQADVEIIQVGKQDRYFLRNQSEKIPSWIIARDWHDAIEYLSVAKNRNKTFVSVFSSQARQYTPWETWFRSWLKRIPSNTILLAHSPLSYQFFKDLVGVAEIQIMMLPLAAPHFAPSNRKKEKGFRVGTFCSFSSTNNLHFVLTLAHYLSGKDQDIHFQLVGSGPLKEHLVKLRQDLGLVTQVEIIESQDPTWVQGFDAVLNFSQHNDHFITELLAGSYGVVPLSIMNPGIESYIQDSFSGFILPLDEIKTVGELVLSLKQNPLLHREMGMRFQKHILTQFGATWMAQAYLQKFDIPTSQNRNFIRCAR